MTADRSKIAGSRIKKPEPPSKHRAERMREVRFQKIDAFSEGIAEGNPAGVVVLERDQELTPEEMQAIARDQKGTVSEVVYCTPGVRGHTRCAITPRSVRSISAAIVPSLACTPFSAGPGHPPWKWS